MVKGTAGGRNAHLKKYWQQQQMTYFPDMFYGLDVKQFRTLSASYGMFCQPQPQHALSISLGYCTSYFLGE